MYLKTIIYYNHNLKKYYLLKPIAISICHFTSLGGHHVFMNKPLPLSRARPCSKKTSTHRPPVDTKTPMSLAFHYPHSCHAWHAHMRHTHDPYFESRIPQKLLGLHCTICSLCSLISLQPYKQRHILHCIISIKAICTNLFSWEQNMTFEET